MTAVRVGERDVADEGDFFQYVFVGVDFVLAAIDDGDGEFFAVLQQHHDGHGKDAIDLSGNGGELAARIVGIFQLDGEEEIGAEQAGSDVGFLEEGRRGGQFFLGELEEDIGGLPLGEQGFLGIELKGSGLELDEVEKGLGLRAIEQHRAVAAVAEGVQQRERRLAQGLGGEGSEGGLDGLAERGHGVKWKV